METRVLNNSAKRLFLYFGVAPKLFTMIYNLMKPFLHQVTIDKIGVYGFDKAEWKAALLEEIDADQLPAYYGGTMVWKIIFIMYK